jgi:hypothetical protein
MANIAAPLKHVEILRNRISPSCWFGDFRRRGDYAPVAFIVALGFLTGPLQASVPEAWVAAIFLS